MLLHLAGRALHTIRGGFAVHGRRSIPPAQLASQNGLIFLGVWRAEADFMPEADLGAEADFLPGADFFDAVFLY